MADSTDADRQWRLNLLKEGTTTVIALSVIFAYLYAAMTKVESPALTNLVLLIIAFYFAKAASSTNFPRRQHRASDDVPRQPLPFQTTVSQDREP